MGAILEIVERHQPQETHEGALKHLREYVERFEASRAGGTPAPDLESAAPACR